ncbi:hypothetical protein [Desulfomicrobium salsuginis]
MLSLIMLLAGCGDGLDVVDAFFVLFAARFHNRGGEDGPAMLGASWNKHVGGDQVGVRIVFSYREVK